MIAAPSPNHGPRRDGAVPDMVVIHFTAMATAEAALARLCDPTAEVSAHYLVGRDGRVWQLVDEDRRAWHAGVSAWGGAVDLNSRSIGIELDNPGDAPFPEPQMVACEALLAAVVARWRVQPERVLGHQCIAPDRKRDPGPRFDWRRLARAGLAVWLDWPGFDTTAGDATAFQHAAARFGYTVPSSGYWDAASLAAAAAFRARFRPFDRGDGPLDAAGVAHLAALSARWPVAPGAAGI